MRSIDLVNACPGLSYRKLNHWCNRGVFGEGLAAPGSGASRVFDDVDLRIAIVLGEISRSLEDWFGPRVGCIELYREIARQIRAGATMPLIMFSQGFSAIIDVESIVGANAPREAV